MALKFCLIHQLYVWLCVLSLWTSARKIGKLTYTLNPWNQMLFDFQTNWYVNDANYYNLTESVSTKINVSFSMNVRQTIKLRINFSFFSLLQLLYLRLNHNVKINAFCYEKKNKTILMSASADVDVILIFCCIHQVVFKKMVKCTCFDLGYASNIFFILN